MPYKDPEKRIEYQRKYRLKNEDKLKEKRKEYAKRHPYKENYKKNAGKIKENQKRYKERNKEKVRTYRKKWDMINIEAKRAAQRRYLENNKVKVQHAARKQKYGITPEDYNKIILEQNYRCDICDIREEETQRGTLCVDHCHETGRVRKLLCNHCNSGLGYFKDNVDLLQKATDYLAEFKYDLIVDFKLERR